MPFVWTRWMDNYYVRWIPFSEKEPGRPWPLQLLCRLGVRRATSSPCFCGPVAGRAPSHMHVRVPAVTSYSAAACGGGQGSSSVSDRYRNETVRSGKSTTLGDVHTPVAGTNAMPGKVPGSVWNAAGSFKWSTLGAVEKKRHVCGRPRLTDALKGNSSPLPLCCF